MHNHKHRCSLIGECKRVPYKVHCLGHSFARLQYMTILTIICLVKEAHSATEHIVDASLLVFDTEQLKVAAVIAVEELKESHA